MHRRRLRRTVVRRGASPAQAPGRRLRARTVQRPDFRVQGRGAADPAALHGAHHAGLWRRGREDHHPHRHLRRLLARPRWPASRCPGHRDHRLLPGRQGLPGPGAADDHEAGLDVQVAAVEGNFDDAQSAVKRIFGDRALAERLAGNSHVALSPPTPSTWAVWCRRSSTTSPTPNCSPTR